MSRPPPPLGTRVEVRHWCWRCLHGDEPHRPARLRGRVVDRLPGGALTAFVVHLDKPWLCPNCREANEVLVSTDTAHAWPLSAVDLLAELVT